MTRFRERKKGWVRGKVQGLVELMIPAVGELGLALYSFFGMRPAR